jgi:hypothetical protein
VKRPKHSFYYEFRSIHNDMAVAKPAESARYRRSRRGAAADIFEGVAEVDIQDLTDCNACLRLQLQEPTSRLRSRRGAVADISGEIEELNERDLLTAITCLRLDEAEETRLRSDSTRSRRNALHDIYGGVDDHSRQNLHNSLIDHENNGYIAEDMPGPISTRANSGDGDRESSEFRPASVVHVVGGN